MAVNKPLSVRISESAASKAMVAESELVSRPNFSNNEGPLMYQVSTVDYMGSAIVPVVVEDRSGFSSMATATDRNGDEYKTGALGWFSSEGRARQFAIEYAQSEIRRRCMASLLSEK